MADEQEHDAGVENKTVAVAALLGEPIGRPEAVDDPIVPGTGGGSPTPDQGAPGSGSGDADESTLTPNSLAEQLGMTPAALFRDLKIPIGDGEPLSLGEFKDAGKQLRDVRDAQTDLAEKRVAFENESMTQRRVLQAAIAKIPQDALTPELIETVQAEHLRYVETERAALLAVRPDLGDAAKWTGIRSMLVEHLSPYGFRDVEIDAIVDHRLAKYIIDNAERALRVVELTKTVEKGAKQPIGRRNEPVKRSRRASKKTAVARGKRATTSRDKTAAVAELLGERMP